MQEQSLVLGRSQLFQFFGLHDDAMIGGVREAPDDGVGFDGTMLGTMFLVLNALAAVGVQEVEMGGTIAGDCGVGFDGKGDQAEAEQSGPTGPAARRGPQTGGWRGRSLARGRSLVR